MDVDAARAIARAVHGGDRPLEGESLLGHIERVAALVPDWARSVAWLHEVLEQSAMREQDLLSRGLSDDELRALRLLSREDSGSDLVYLGHIKLIAQADGAAGRLARAVKRADLEDRLRHPLVRSNGWSPPYESALQMLKRAGRRDALRGGRLTAGNPARPGALPAPSP
jgi:hypothetical protein